PDGQPNQNSFFIGSNNLGQSGPSYISAASCGIANPTNLASIGFPNMHIVMNVLGACGPCATPTPTPTPSVTPPPPTGDLNEGFDLITTLIPSGWYIQNNSQPLGAQTWFQG